MTHLRSEPFPEKIALEIGDGTQEAHRKPVVLVVEDNEELRSFLVRGLSEEFDVISAADGVNALQLAVDQVPDLVLSDLMMPGLDGYDLCRRIRDNPSIQSLPFILLTARGEMEAKLTGLNAGADDYLEKPFHLQEVKTRIKSQLRFKALARRASQHEKLAALGTVVAGVAHEVRNPLNGVLNSLGPLRVLLTGQPEALALVDLALQGAKRIESISNQLLRQARAGEGERCEVNLVDNVTLALHLLAHRTAGGGPRLRSTWEVTHLPVLGEPGALNQVWINLVDNAIDAAGPLGEVSVKVEPVEGHAVVEVSDNGPGIPPRLLQRIFDPFFTTKAVGRGTGLGLSVVREIVEQHKGTIRVQSTPETGTRFRVILPALRAVPGELYV